MTFEEALVEMKKGEKVARQGWNGKGMWASLVTATNYTVLFPPHNGEDTAEGECKGLRPWLGLIDVQGNYGPWVPSTSDLLAVDWLIVR